jgi:hypothetical protein
MPRGIDDAVSAETQILKENRARKKKEAAKEKEAKELWELIMNFFESKKK